MVVKTFCQVVELAFSWFPLNAFHVAEAFAVHEHKFVTVLNEAVGPT